MGASETDGGWVGISLKATDARRSTPETDGVQFRLCSPSSDFDPTSHADFGAATPPGRGRWHAPSSRHLRALLSVCEGCSFGGLGCCSCRVCVWGVLFSVGACV